MEKKEKIILEVIDLHKKYHKSDKAAIDKINFKIAEGEFHVFIGANGAGKTTTIKALVGAYKKWDGQIKVYGQDIWKFEAKRHIGYIPEHAVFPREFTTKDYLVSMGILSGLSKKDATKYCIEKLEELNMQNMINKKPYTFSSGQKKKILLAQALIIEPSLLIMDEPAANLDPLARHELFEILLKLKSEGKSIFIASHILAEVEQYTDAVTILDGGKIVYTGKYDKSKSLTDLYIEKVKLGSVDSGTSKSKKKELEDMIII